MSRKLFVVLVLVGGLATVSLVLAQRNIVPYGEPRVVATSPAAGATVAPGPLTISVTFDRPMRRGSYSFVQLSAADYPDCARTPEQSRDRRQFTLACRVEAGRSYRIGFNGGGFLNFRDDVGAPATPHVLNFAVRPAGS